MTYYPPHIPLSLLLEVHEVIDNFTALDPGITDLRALVEDTGGAGLCDDISATVVSALGGCIVWFHEGDEMPSWYPRLTGDHAVACVTWGAHRYYVDLTARQFDENAPFPAVWPAYAR